MLVAGPIMTRVYCELLILLFKIFDRLGEIQAALTDRAYEPVAEEPPARPTAPDAP